MRSSPNNAHRFLSHPTSLAQTLYEAAPQSRRHATPGQASRAEPQREPTVEAEQVITQCVDAIQIVSCKAFALDALPEQAANARPRMATTRLREPRPPKEFNLFDLRPYAFSVSQTFA